MGSPSGPSAGGQGQRQPQHSRGTSKPGRGLGMRHSLSHEKDAFLWIQRWMGADGQGSVHYITSPQPQPGSFPAPGLSSHRPSQPQWALSTQCWEPAGIPRQEKLQTGEEAPSSFADLLFCPWRRSCGYSQCCPGSWAGTSGAE